MTDPGVFAATLLRALLTPPAALLAVAWAHHLGFLTEQKWLVWHLCLPTLLGLCVAPVLAARRKLLDS